MFKKCFEETFIYFYLWALKNNDLIDILKKYEAT